MRERERSGAAMERLVVISALASPRHDRQSPIDLQRAGDGSNVQSEV